LLWRHGSRAARAFFVASEIIDDDNGARPDSRHKYLLDIGQGAFSVDRAIDDAGASMRTEPSLPAARLSVHGHACTRHVGLGPGLVDEDQASSINQPLILYPLRPTFSDVGTILLAGAQAILKLMPSCSKKCHTT
jgi:hypothetical protein